LLADAGGAIVAHSCICVARRLGRDSTLRINRITDHQFDWDPKKPRTNRAKHNIDFDVYDNLPAVEQLQKAVNDARAVGAAPRQLGFETAVEENVAKLPFTRAWQKFLNRLQPGGTAALFFAGHGVEVGGLNYLLPRDVPKVVGGEDRVLAEASIRFNTLMEDLRDKNVRTALFIVDACRAILNGYTKNGTFFQEYTRSPSWSSRTARSDPWSLRTA
jgi:hypothetical protein